jgi:hypothetical protein
MLLVPDPLEPLGFDAGDADGILHQLGGVRASTE